MVTDEEALLELLRRLKSHGYQFSCVTPATHQRVLVRRVSGELTLRDIFGWNRPFRPDQLDGDFQGLLRRAGALDEVDGGVCYRSGVRVASLADHLFVHSSYPTDSPNAVFFGPDTYRFVNFVTARLEESAEARTVVDMGAGSGAAGIAVAALMPSSAVTLVDVNPQAAALARINARAASVTAEVTISREIPAGCDLVIANPPYMMDEGHRAYRDGGGLLGGEVALDWVAQGLRSLRAGGAMLLYTGAAVVDGTSPLLDALSKLCSSANASLGVTEIDPDVFGEELDKPRYADVERIAVFGLEIRLGV